MKNIVISGAGPIGLYLAIRLKQIIRKHGLSTTVTVIDPRAGKYDRPGIVANKALTTLEKGIGAPLPPISEGDDIGTAMFIKDLEKALFEVAKKNKVKFELSSFQSFSESGLLTISKDHTQTTLPCDFAIDCTGSRRSLIHQFNEEIENKFEIKAVGDNPVKNHFIAYVTMDQKNAALMHEVLPGKKDPVKHALMLEKLRTEFGWPEFVEPEFSLRTYTTKSKDKESTTRFYLYFETPPNLPKEKEVDWLKALLEFKTQNENIQFEIETGKMKFIPFLVDPHKVEQPLAETKKMTVVPAGDAQIDPDYRLGIGILSGASRADALLNSLETKNGELILNKNKYQELIKEPTLYHEKELEKDYATRKKGFSYGLETQKKIYTRALSHPDIKQQGQDIIKRGLSEINKRLALEQYFKSLSHLDKAMHSGKVILTKYKEIKDLSSLEDGEIALKNSHELLSPSDDKELKKVTNQLIDLALAYKELGNDLFKANKIGEAKRYYLKSLNLLDQYAKNQHQEEVTKIYSNLCLILNKQKKYEETIKMAQTALKSAKEEKMILKIQYNHCLALLELSLLVKRPEELDNYHTKAKSTFKKIELTLDPVSKKNLESKFQLVNEKLSKPLIEALRKK